MNARDHALRLIQQAKLPGWHKPITKAASRAPADPRDLALGETIAMSVIRNHSLLRHLIKHYSGRDLNQIDPPVQMVIAVALAQLRYLTRVPASAAVDEAVEQVKRLKLGRAGAFVNAVLRRATREPVVELPKKEDPERYAQIVLSHPPELYRKLVKAMGPKKALQLCEKNNTPAPTILRLSGTFSALKPRLSDGALDREVTLIPHSSPGFAVVEGASESDFARWSKEGLAQVQDPTSAGIVSHLALDHGLRVLDRCCGLGTKTIQIAERVGETGLVVATDPAKHRIDRLNHLLKERGMTWVQAHAVGMLDQIKIDAPFDRVLIDAPCSNSGVLPRRPEARYRQDDKSLASLRELQRRILLDTAPHVRPGGVLVYSTCSIWNEENGEQIQWLLQQVPGFEIIHVATTLPSLESDPIKHVDGGFVAALARTK